MPSYSLIVCTKNDTDKLLRNLPGMLSQSHQPKEIIIVDDFSETNESAKLKNALVNTPNVQLLQPNKDILGKKLALRTGVLAAKAECILVTDADCQVGPDWAKIMLSNLGGSKEIVLGYGAYKKEDSWINKWIRYETWLTAVQYFSYAIWRHPYMGVGRNMAYQRAAYLQVNPEDLHLDIASGDDDLLIAQIANTENTTICTDPSTFTYATPSTTLKQYISQKIRHYSVATKYRLKHKISLSLFSGSHILFYTLLLAWMVLGNWKMVLVVYCCRMIPVWIVNYFLFRKLREVDLWKYWPLLDLLTLVHYVYFSYFVFFPKNTEWKSTTT